MESPSDRLYILHPTEESMPFTLYFHPLYLPQSIWDNPPIDEIYILFLADVPVNSYLIPESEQAFLKASYTVSPSFIFMDVLFNMIPSDGRVMPGLSWGLLSAALQDIDMVTFMVFFSTNAAVV